MNTTSRQKRFEALVGAYTNDLYRYGYWLCRDAMVAEDLVQETLMRAWRSMDKLRDSKAVKAWLITTLRRENARRFERKRFDTVDIDDHPVADHNSENPEHAMLMSQVRHELMALAQEYREPLTLQVMMGHSVAEIAEIMDLSQSAVMTRLFRARNQLAKRLEEPAATIAPERLASHA